MLGGLGRSPARQAGERTEMLRSWGRPPSGMWSRQPTTSPCHAPQQHSLGLGLPYTTITLTLNP